MATTKIETKWKSNWVEMLGTQTRFIKGKKYTTRAIEAGSGDALILIHGIGGYGETWARNIMNLAQHYHIYAIDALYHGFSTKEPFDGEGGNRTIRQAEAVLDMMDAEGIEWAHVEGCSMGAAIAFVMGMQWPERCGKIILNTGAPVNFKRTFGEQPAGGGDTLRKLSQGAILDLSLESVRQRLEWLMASPDRVTDEMVEARFKLYSMPEINKSMRNMYGLGGFPMTVKRYEEEECQNFKPKSLVFWTDSNPGQGAEVGEYLASLIPGAEHYCMHDSAHWPHWEHPEEHDEVVLSFLKKK